MKVVSERDSFALTQAAEGFGDFGLSFDNPDFVKYAESYGVRGTRIAATAYLARSLEAAFVQGGVHLVIVPVDNIENKRVLIRRIEQQGCRTCIVPASPFERNP